MKTPLFPLSSDPLLAFIEYTENFPLLEMNKSLHGHQSLCYFFHSKRHTAWHNKTHLSIAKTRASLIASIIIFLKMLISEGLVKTLESRPDQITTKTSFWHAMTNNS